jgi:acetate---CoA ligase (ADP-forming)
MMNPARNLHSLLEPTSIAVVGASDGAGPGRQVLDNLARLGYQGPVIPINPKYETVGDRRCFPSLAEAARAGMRPDAVAILLGRERVGQILREAAAVGVRGAWAFASGFAEAGARGKALQEDVAEVCSQTGIAFCGPNCVGYVNPVSHCGLLSAPVSPSLAGGTVSAVVQSGSIALALVNSARGLGFRTIISSGNEAVLDTTDYIDYLLDDPETRVILAFIEQLRRPRRFVEIAERARRIGKPIIVLKVGRSAMARQATLAHTGALAGSDAVYDAAFRKHGVLRVEDLDEMLETANAFACMGTTLPRGPRVGMLTVSGGEISLIGDLAEGLPLEFPPWSSTARAAFAAALPDYAAISNPLDAWGSGIVEQTYPPCIDAAADDEVDLVIVSQDAPSGLAEEQVAQFATIGRAAAAAHERTGKPIMAVSHLSGGLDPLLRQTFEESGVPLLQGTREGLRAAAHLIAFERSRQDSAPPVSRQRRRPLLGSKGGPLDEVESKAILSSYGIPIVDEAVCGSISEALAAASRFGYPVVVKALSSALPHKTDAGVIRLGVPDPEALEIAYRDVLARARDQAPPASIRGVLVQRMVQDAVAEAIVGVVKDGTFGSVVVLGLGGTFVELLEDRALGIPPLDAQAVEAMLADTRLPRLLAGFRGAPAGDKDALVEVVCRMGDLALDQAGAVCGVDINPLLVLPRGRGVVAVDALVETRSEGQKKGGTDDE